MTESRAKEARVVSDPYHECGSCGAIIKWDRLAPRKIETSNAIEPERGCPECGALQRDTEFEELDTIPTELADDIWSPDNSK